MERLGVHLLASLSGWFTVSTASAATAEPHHSAVSSVTKGDVTFYSNGIRVFLGTGDAGSFTVDLPVQHRVETGAYSPWWYVGAVRQVATWISEQKSPEDIPEDGGAVDADYLFAHGIVGDQTEVSPDDALDFVVADMAGDPLWNNGEASVEPDVYVLVGFRRLDADRVRIYLRHGERITGIDLATVDRESGHPRVPGWWASTKVVAILRDAETLAVHASPTAEDPYCDRVHDLTTWA
jgi:hypothetical protein